MIVPSATLQPSIVSHGPTATGAQPHPGGAITVIVPAPPPAGSIVDGGVSPVTHGGCTTTLSKREIQSYSD